MTEREAMERALELAWKGWGRVQPNPMVGCVILRGGELIAEGFHREFGGPHAEIMALSACAACRGATAVLTLEPCNHHGQTPPCSEALIEAGVARLVYALPDPHPEAGGGAARLRAAGIAVESGVLSERAAALNAAFLWTVTRPERPFVALKVATSLDGYVADAGQRSQWIAGAEAREWVHWLRAGFDALAVGRHTAETDDPQLTARGSVTPRIPPVRIVLSRGAMLRSDLRLVRTAHELPTLFVTAPQAAGVAERELSGTGVVVVPAEDLAAGLRRLRERGIRSVLVEGGGRLATALLAADLVDRLYWVQSPLWLGSGRAAFGERPAVALRDAARWVVTERRALGADTLLVVDRALCLPAS